MPGYGLEPQVVLTTPLLEGIDGVEKMSKSLGNYVGVTEAPDEMFGKLMSISDELMWRYYILLTDLSPAEIEGEKAARPADGVEARARAADRRGLPRRRGRRGGRGRVAARAPAAAKRPREMRVVTVAAGPHKPHLLVVEAGLAKSNGEAMRLLRQNAVRRDGAVLAAGAEVALASGEGFVLSVGPARHVRVEAS